MEWPAGIGAKGNEGVAGNVGQTKGSIGYVEYAYAKQNKLTLHQDDQQGRQGGEPTIEAFQAAAAERRLGQRARLRRHPHRPARREASWPITGAPSS